eukprot:TRINITY_DN23350_c0_g1_i1.p1 TRINITY_DN23350_c0_g1~~TRINITY_DN23350_c0_g1_i1.p1  ORF type:complete len:605 (-),score=107.35 TRINITY_DN23350_c0_g1_i1:96-1865(-)
MASRKRSVPATAGDVSSKKRSTARTPETLSGRLPSLSGIPVSHEVLVTIFQYIVDPADYGVCALVCRNWRSQSWQLAQGLVCANLVLDPDCIVGLSKLPLLRRVACVSCTCESTATLRALSSLKNLTDLSVDLEWTGSYCCDGCEEEIPESAPRFECSQCEGFYFCTACKERNPAVGKHTRKHTAFERKMHQSRILQPLEALSGLQFLSIVADRNQTIDFGKMTALRSLTIDGEMGEYRPPLVSSASYQSLAGLTALTRIVSNDWQNYADMPALDSLRELRLKEPIIFDGELCAHLFQLPKLEKFEFLFNGPAVPWRVEGLTGLRSLSFTVPRETDEDAEPQTCDFAVLTKLAQLEELYINGVDFSRSDKLAWTKKLGGLRALAIHDAHPAAEADLVALLPKLLQKLLKLQGLGLPDCVKVAALRPHPTVRELSCVVRASAEDIAAISAWKLVERFGLLFESDQQPDANLFKPLTSLKNLRELEIGFRDPDTSKHQALLQQLQSVLPRVLLTTDSASFASRCPFPGLLDFNEPPPAPVAAGEFLPGEMVDDDDDVEEDEDDDAEEDDAEEDGTDEEQEAGSDDSDGASE